MKKTVTAKDVAKLAGVSQSSVSRVYFTGAAVSEKTKKKVLAAAAELGYHPNEFARSLITNRTKIIGLVMKGVQNPFYPQVLSQFTAEFKKWGYSVLFVHTNNEEIQNEDVETLLNYNVAGVIITDATMSLKVAKSFKNNEIPLVFFNRKIHTNDFYSVSCNNLNASRRIAEFLLAKGGTSMVYLAGNEQTSTSREREEGFTEILSDHNISYKKYSSDFTYEGGYHTALEIVKHQLPSAFFVANDIMALGVLDALRKKGIRVPEDTKVVGFDNIEMSGWPAYQLTTWEQPINQMVEKTVNYLLKEMANYTGMARTVEVEGSLIERKTT
ncbi:LacI family DNA-binding transcriptional regulator [Jeotgalibacillus proteolyticus]|uniref:LacI family transcriptional regulator n=1 Tax=Jeotgalibacillus proteolyticus TaxID=2082395 RepID=A0A2S5GD68_9BACL|nr:LacI family DNA-binding transcriptional regulator [Jeotgalibacillus proteolyticus]PPA70865.1 LacI family transcriptional regulator [Jeotgalibacillus proteolyticus]